MVVTTTPYTLPVQRVQDGLDLTWAVLVPTNPDGTGITFMWAGRNTPHWWRTKAMTDQFRAMERDGYRLMLHPSNNTVLVEREPTG